VPRPPRAHRIDHELSVQFASGLGSNDLVVSPEPEAFLNQGVKAMNAVFVSELKDELEAQLRSGGKAWYHVGVRTNDTDSREGRADRWVKSNFELHLIESHEIRGMRIAFYDVYSRTSIGKLDSAPASNARAAAENVEDVDSNRR